MSEKITTLHISDVLAVKLTFPKHVTDSFMRSLSETIVQGLQTDGIVKVRGLGTFRIVDMESRESISVSTGERIVIPSFKKISFTAEDAVTERLSSGAIPAPKEVDIESIRFAADRCDDKIKFTDEALMNFVKVPRPFLKTVLNGCIDWAKENDVELITDEHIKIINDKRRQEKGK